MKNPSRPSSRFLFFLSVAKNRLLISSKTAALGVPRKNGNLKKATLFKLQPVTLRTSQKIFLFFRSDKQWKISQLIALFLTHQSQICKFDQPAPSFYMLFSMLLSQRTKKIVSQNLWTQLDFRPIIRLYLSLHSQMLVAKQSIRNEF